jgi:hypothetical protein
VKVTDPVGVPEVPLTVALSVADVPITFGVVDRVGTPCRVLNASAEPVIGE